MGGVVGTNHTDGAIGNTPPQCLTVLGPLDGRVAFYQTALLRIVGTAEEQMGHRGLKGDIVGRQCQLSPGADMGYVQAGAKLAGKGSSQRRRLEAGFLGAYQRMEHHVGVIAIRLLHLLHVAVYYVSILTMRHDGQS